MNLIQDIILVTLMSPLMGIVIGYFVRMIRDMEHEKERKDDPPPNR